MKEFPLIKKWLDLDIRDHTTRLVVDAYDLEAKLSEGFELIQNENFFDNEWTTHEEILGGKSGRENIATHKCLAIGRQPKHKKELEHENSELKELHRMQLAAISVCLLQNTRESALKRINKNNLYWTATYQDACNSIDREMKLIAQLEIATKVLAEQCCIDDCGFDVENEDIDILRSCMKAIDFEAREALDKIESAGE